MARPRAAAKAGKRGALAFVHTWVDLFARHNLLTWASAIAFQVLVALVPLTLLVFGVLGRLDERSVWRKQISPGIRRRAPQPVFDAVNYAVDRILSHATAGLLVFASALTIWELSGSVRAVMGAANRIYDVGERRPAWRRFGTSFVLAIAIACCVLGAVLVLTLAKHVGGSLHFLVDIVRWLAAVVLLGLAVELLVRFAPAQRRAKKWVTLGTGFTVVAWVVASLVFRWWVTSVASFRSTWGTFVAVLVLTGYLYTSAIVFLVGVQADELVRKDATAGERGIFDRVRAALG
jgi:membrane protein